MPNYLRGWILTPMLAAAGFAVAARDAAADVNPHYPPADIVWTRSQYSDFYFTYFNTHIALPHLRSEPSRLLFKRLINRDNIEAIIASSAGKDSKLNELNIILAAMGSIRASYNLAVIAGEPLQEELTEVQIFNLYLIGAFADVAGSDIAAPGWQSAMKTAFFGVVESLSETNTYSPGQITILGDALARRYPAVGRFFLDHEKRALIARVAALQDQQIEPQPRLALTRLLSTLSAN